MMLMIHNHRTLYAGWQTMTPEQLKSEALQVSKPFSPPILHDIITNTPPNNFWKSSVRQRLNRHHLDQTLVVNNVTVAGDACHPMTPHLGQGGAMALEDAIVLARHLHGALGVVDGEKKVSGELENLFLEVLAFNSNLIFFLSSIFSSIWTFFIHFLVTQYPIHYFSSTLNSSKNIIQDHIIVGFNP